MEVEGERRGLEHTGGDLWRGNGAALKGRLDIGLQAASACSGHS